MTSITHSADSQSARQQNPQEVDQQIIEKMESLKTRAAQLNQRKTRIDLQVENARKQYQEMSAEAKEKFGTDNLDEIKQLLLERRRENAAAVENFEKALNEAEARIIEAEKIAGLAR